MDGIHAPDCTSVGVPDRQGFYLYAQYHVLFRAFVRIYGVAFFEFKVR